MNMATQRNDVEFRFSMRALLIALTVACVILAFPSGYLLLLVGMGWFLLQAGIIWFLVKFRTPIYRVLQGNKKFKESESHEQSSLE